MTTNEAKKVIEILVANDDLDMNDYLCVIDMIDEISQKAQEAKND